MLADPIFHNIIIIWYEGVRGRWISRYYMLALHWEIIAFNIKQATRDISDNYVSTYVLFKMVLSLNKSRES